jgi:hypothetical protein
MLYFDKQKVYIEEKPPIPVVSLGEQKTQVLLGSAFKQIATISTNFIIVYYLVILCFYKKLNRVDDGDIRYKYKPNFT